MRLIPLVVFVTLPFLAGCPAATDTESYVYEEPVIINVARFAPAQSEMMELGPATVTAVYPGGAVLTDFYRPEGISPKVYLAPLDGKIPTVEIGDTGTLYWYGGDTPAHNTYWLLVGT